MADRTAIAPLVLMDTYDEGVCESLGWVEAKVDEERARRELAPYCLDEDRNSPCLPDCGPAQRVWLRADDPIDMESSWTRCELTDEGAIEFWEVPVA